MKIAVYTANIGNYDLIHNIYQKMSNVDYYYFTDSGDPICGWKKVPIKLRHHDTDVKEARWFKTHSNELFPNHDVTIWVDARFIVNTVDISKYVSESLKKKSLIAQYPHLKRS